MTQPARDELAEAFRARYRAQIAAGYSGARHAAIVFAFGLAGIAACLGQVAAWSPAPALAVVAGLLTMNVGHYAVHRWLGHRKTAIGKLFYARHTGDHHAFFTYQAYTIDSARDLRVVLFPVFLLFALELTVVPLGVIGVGRLVGAAAGWAYGAALLIGYVWYEFVHLVDHLPDSVGLTRWPVLAGLRAHHRLHHDRARATRNNLNITLPLTDLALGTLAQRRK